MINNMLLLKHEIVVTYFMVKQGLNEGIEHRSFTRVGKSNRVTQDANVALSLCLD